MSDIRKSGEEQSMEMETLAEGSSRQQQTLYSQSNNGIFNLTITITGLTKFLHDTITNRCSIMGKGKQQVGAGAS